MKKLLAPTLWLALVLFQVLPAAAEGRITVNHNQTTP
jgi:hypothetical protein